MFVTVPRAELALTTVADGSFPRCCVGRSPGELPGFHTFFFLHPFWLVWDLWKQGESLHSTKHRCQEILASGKNGRQRWVTVGPDAVWL